MGASSGVTTAASADTGSGNALVIIHAQEGYIGEYGHTHTAADNIAQITQERPQGAGQIVHVLTTYNQDGGKITTGAELGSHFESGDVDLLHPTINVRPDDMVVLTPAHNANPFDVEGVTETFRANGIGNVALCGFSTRHCVAAAARGANENGFKLFIVADATGSTRDVDARRAGIGHIPSTGADVNKLGADYGAQAITSHQFDRPGVWQTDQTAQTFQASLERQTELAQNYVDLVKGSLGEGASDAHIIHQRQQLAQQMVSEGFNERDFIHMFGYAPSVAVATQDFKTASDTITAQQAQNALQTAQQQRQTAISTNPPNGQAQEQQQQQLHATPNGNQIAAMNAQAHGATSLDVGSNQPSMTQAKTETIVSGKHNQPSHTTPDVTTHAPAENTVNPPVAGSRLSARLQGANGHVSVAGLAINLTDAVIKGDDEKAAEVVGGAAVVRAGTKLAAMTVGVKSVPIVGQVIGAGFAAKDTYNSAINGHTGRAALSGVETTLYTVAAGSGAAAAGLCWNPIGWGAGAVALAAGGAAVTITAGKSVYDNWNTVSGWFGHDSNDNHGEDSARPASAEPTKQATAPATTAQPTQDTAATLPPPLPPVALARGSGLRGVAPGIPALTAPVADTVPDPVSETPPINVAATKPMPISMPIFMPI